MKKNLLITLLLACGTSAFAQWTTISQGYTDLVLNDIYVTNLKIIAVGTKFMNNNFWPHIVTANLDGSAVDTTIIPPQGYFFKTIAFKDKDTGFIGGYGSSSIWLQTTDGGTTWKYYMQDVANKGITDMQFLNNKIGYACGYGAKQFFSGNVYKTIDGGLNWDAQLDPMDSLPMDGIKMVNEQYGYGWGGTFGAKKMVKTIDGGNTWTHYYTHTAIPGGMFWWNVNEGILVDGAGGIYKTSNAGATWSAKNSGITTALTSVTFMDRYTGFAVGLNGIILKTTNGGETWIKETGVPTTMFLKVEYHGDRFYTIGEDGTILRSSVLTGTEQVKANPLEQLVLYPNPAVSEIHIDKGGVTETPQLIITDINGKMIYSNKLTARIDISSYPPGVYLVHVFSEENRIVKKLIITH